MYISKLRNVKFTHFVFFYHKLGIYRKRKTMIEKDEQIGKSILATFDSFSKKSDNTEALLEEFEKRMKTLCKAYEVENTHPHTRNNTRNA